MKATKKAAIRASIISLKALELMLQSCMVWAAVHCQGEDITPIAVFLGDLRAKIKLLERRAGF